ncbi:DUF2835 family protein [Psychromonas sp. KJ10-10]|uniref:DUF2835 family protein n=1 Tax=Psychromonas sp. KJ10-10 TaxID=3391823 RepID=UPI0039B477A5
MTHFYFRINIPYNSFQELYRTPNTVVKVREERGKMLQIPALKFVPFFSQLGVRGRFELTLGENNKFVSLQQVGQ